ITDLAVHGPTVVFRPCSLGVAEEWLARVVDDYLLAISERRVRNPQTPPCTLPPSQEKGQCCAVGMQGWVLHRGSVAHQRASTRTPCTAPASAPKGITLGHHGVLLCSMSDQTHEGANFPPSASAGFIHSSARLIIASRRRLPEPPGRRHQRSSSRGRRASPRTAAPAGAGSPMGPNG